VRNFIQNYLLTSSKMGRADP